MIRRPIRSFVLAAALALSVLAAEARACPNCRENLPNGKQADGSASGPTVAQGYAWSIYLMIAVPFVLAGTMGVTAFVLVRKAGARGAAIVR
jgi:hypothetical protein